MLTFLGSGNEPKARRTDQAIPAPGVRQRQRAGGETVGFSAAGPLAASRRPAMTDPSQRPGAEVVRDA